MQEGIVVPILSPVGALILVRPAIAPGEWPEIPDDLAAPPRPGHIPEVSGTV